MNFKSVLLSGLLFASSSSMSVVLANEMFVNSGTSPTTMASVQNYWTKERMENAKPYPNTIEGEQPNLYAAGTIPPQADGEPGATPGGKPKLKKTLLRKFLGEETIDTKEEPIPLEGYSHPFPFTRFQVTPYLNPSSTSKNRISCNT